MGYELVNRNGRGDVYLLYEFRMTVRKFIDSRFKLMEATLLGT
jgi:hypothetical protein